MAHRTIFLALYLAVASAALGQSVEPASVRTPGPRPVSKIEGRSILAAISTVDEDSDFETDCSHLVHDVYENAGFSYDYASSRELYVGRANFTRVRKPQAGDLVVWQGHVGIVVDPKEHSFFSFVRSGPDTQFYDSTYWRSRGSARFYRYIVARSRGSGRTLEAMRETNDETLAAGRSENRPPAGTSKRVRTNAIRASEPADSDNVHIGLPENAPGSLFEVAGKNPIPDEIVAAFVAMNQSYGESLRMAGFDGLARRLIVYRELRVSALDIKGKHGTALISLESLAGLPTSPASVEPRWRELSLEFEKTKKGWVMSPLRETAYVSQEVALQTLSARLARLSQNADATLAQKREEKQIIHFLNLLVEDDSRAASAQRD